MTRYGCHATCSSRAHLAFVGGDLLGDITSCFQTAGAPRQCASSDAAGTKMGGVGGGVIVPSQCDTQTGAPARCDERHNGRTNSEQQLNNREPTTFFPPAWRHTGSVALPGWSLTGRYTLSLTGTVADQFNENNCRVIICNHRLIHSYMLLSDCIRVTFQFGMNPLSLNLFS